MTPDSGTGNSEKWMDGDTEDEADAAGDGEGGNENENENENKRRAGDPGERPADQSDVPFADLVEETDRFEAMGALEDLAEEAFVEIDVDQIDTDSLWRELEGHERRPVPPGTVERRVVPKREYCQKCEYFSPPPDVHCTHQATTILEMVDVDHFRVENCPIVYEKEHGPNAEL